MNTELDAVSLEELSAFELQEAQLAAAQSAAREGLLARSALYRLGIDGEPLCVLRLWYRRERDVKLLDRTAGAAAAALCDAFGRDVEWQAESK